MFVWAPNSCVAEVGQDTGHSFHNRAPKAFPPSAPASRKILAHGFVFSCDLFFRVSVGKTEWRPFNSTQSDTPLVLLVLPQVHIKGGDPILPIPTRFYEKKSGSSVGEARSNAQGFTPSQSDSTLMLFLPGAFCCAKQAHEPVGAVHGGGCGGGGRGGGRPSGGRCTRRHIVRAPVHFLYVKTEMCFPDVSLPFPPPPFSLPPEK